MPEGIHIPVDLDETDEASLERIPPERIDTAVLAAADTGLAVEQVESALRNAGRPRGERAQVASRLMHLAVTGLKVVAIGTDSDDRIVLDLSNTTQDVVASPKA